MAPPSFDLGIYASKQKYDDICRRRWDRPYDLTRLEDDWKALGNGEPLRLRHVKELFDKERTPFGHFWEEPAIPEEEPEEKISLVLSDSDQPGGAKEQELCRNLFSTLGSMEAASVLLRCVHPARFGIYSPPLLAFLQIPLAPPVEHYMEVCKELRLWRDQFSLKSVGETDRALWVFYEDAYGPKHTENPEQLRASFERDGWVRGRQAFNVLHRFFKSFETLKQASILAEIDPNLAGKVAGCEFERMLRTVTGEWQETDMPAIINNYVKNNGSPPSTKNALHWVWRRRVDTVHSLADLSEQNVAKMINIIRNLLPPPTENN